MCMRIEIHWYLLFSSSHDHMTTSSPLLTKLRRPIIILLQFILGNRRKGMLEDLLEVLDLDIGRAKFLRGDIPDRQPLSSAAAARVVLPGRIRGKLRRTARAAGVVLTGDQISFLIRTKLLRLLTSSQRLHRPMGRRHMGWRHRPFHRHQAH